LILFCINATSCSCGAAAFSPSFDESLNTAVVGGNVPPSVKPVDAVTISPPYQ
jgi:hypothetical protein